jgi:hypothetical protein
MRRPLARDSAAGHKGAAVSTSDRRRPRERISTGALAFSQGFEGIVGGTPLIIIEQRGATAIPLRPFSPSPRIPQGISNTH